MKNNHAESDVYLAHRFPSALILRRRVAPSRRMGRPRCCNIRAAPSFETTRLRFAPARLLTMRPGGTAPSATNGALPRAVLTDLANRGVRFCGLFVLVYVR